MSDIYNIPQDDKKSYRLKKFVEYQHKAQAVDSRFLKAWANTEKLSKNQVVDMAFLHAVLYNEITAVLLLEMRKQWDYTEIWNKYNKSINIGSARKHTRYNDMFVILINEYERITQEGQWRAVEKLLTDDAISNYKRLYNWIGSIHGVGRFSADLFCEVLLLTRDYLGLNIQQTAELDWVNGCNLTSGIYNIFYEDEKANDFDKHKKVTPIEARYLSSKLVRIQKEIEKTYPEDAEITMFIGKICSFRNLFKGARYGGFHHDRQLAVIKNYEREFPEYQYLWDKCYQIRKDIFPHVLLGELNGWDGVRTERKKLWLNTGYTGVEDGV